LGRLEGRYLFADHCNERLRSFRPSRDGADGAGPVREHSLEAPAATSFLSGRKNRVYVTTILGDLFRLKR
ncbi:MAG TPA: hypothetical protein VKA36_03230, partial [Solirubrobacterales bacterium]|nr:hypothetical protein [Solirubrobacterales bacterium]